jgi:pyruvate dehydrogenase E1 component alpha subunit
LIGCKTYRFTSHSGAGKGRHNNPEELKQWLKRDPIALFEKKLIDDGVMTAEEQQAIKDKAIAEVEEAVSFAKRSPFPELSELPVVPGTEL